MSIYGVDNIVLHRENNDVDKAFLCVEEAGNGNGKICISPINNIDIGKEPSSLNLDEITAVMIAVRLYLNSKNNGNSNSVSNTVHHNGNGKSVSPWLYSWLEEATRNNDLHIYFLRRNSLYSNS